MSIEWVMFTCRISPFEKEKAWVFRNLELIDSHETLEAGNIMLLIEQLETNLQINLSFEQSLAFQQPSYATFHLTLLLTA